MLLRRFYDTKLAQASYLVGCQATGEALIIDPNRDIEQYVAAVRAEKMRLAFVTETHIHADYLSGSRELAAVSGAKLLLSDEGGEGWRYGFAAADKAVLMKDGHTFKVGNIVVRALHTPGHTPEHMSFMITDGAATDRPMGVFTGDFIFVGDVGRPDLLEKAAGITGTMEAGARQLFRSIQEFKKLPDYLQIWPGHGAGSACGKALGAVPSSTLGYERFANWALATENENDFVAMVLAGQPEPPTYFARMKALNRDGPPALGGFRTPAKLDAAKLKGALAAGNPVVDIRPTAAFGKSHAEGAINIPLTAFARWAGWYLPYDRDIYLIAESEDRAAEAAKAGALIGLDRVAGWFPSDAVPGGQSVRQQNIHDVAAELASGSATVVDVRWQDEWDAGHLPGARHVPMSRLRSDLARLDRDKPIVLHCESGSRSNIAAGIAQQMGFKDVRNMTGGWNAWSAAGLPTTQTATASGAAVL